MNAVPSGAKATDTGSDRPPMAVASRNPAGRGVRSVATPGGAEPLALVGASTTSSVDATSASEPTAMVLARRLCMSDPHSRTRCGPDADPGVGGRASHRAPPVDRGDRRPGDPDHEVVLAGALVRPAD